MTQGTDILAKIAALSSSFDAFKANFDKAIADMSATVPAGHAAVLETFVAPLDELAAKISTLEGEMPAKVAAVHVSGVAPVAP